MAEEQTFRELIHRVRAGDQEAAAELVRRYEPTIRRVARLRLADTRLQRIFDSMDICQSVLGSFFVRMALGQYDLDKPEQLLKLLVSMSHKKVVNYARRAGAARRDYRRAQAGPPEEELLVARDPSPSQQLMVGELVREFRKRMTEEERQLAEQRAAGLDWNQIASERGGRPEALRKQLARAVERVKTELGLEEYL
jgi:RNA polymerase sigma-70 factor (ECF subfamily)